MTEYVILSAILFSIGGIGVLIRRNAIVVFMCVELMLNACNLAFVAFAHQHGNLEGQVTAFFVMVVAAAEVVVLEPPGGHPYRQLPPFAPGTGAPEGAVFFPSGWVVMSSSSK